MLNNPKTPNDQLFMHGAAAEKYAAFSPLLRARHHNRMLYREKFVALIEVHNFTVTPSGLNGDAQLIHLLYVPEGLQGWAEQPTWSFGATWDMIIPVSDTPVLGLAALYCGWTIWPEAGLITRAEKLIARGEGATILPELDAYYSDKR